MYVFVHSCRKLNKLLKLASHIKSYSIKQKLDMPEKSGGGAGYCPRVLKAYFIQPLVP